MVVIDHFDEGLDLGSLLDSLFAHAACDFGWVAFNAGDKCVGERMGLCTRVYGLDYDNLKK
jgi:hypothetical protein